MYLVIVKMGGSNPEEGFRQVVEASTPKDGGREPS